MKTFTGKSRVSLLLSLAGLVSIVAAKAASGPRTRNESAPRVARHQLCEGSVSLQPAARRLGQRRQKPPMTIVTKFGSTRFPAPNCKRPGGHPSRKA